MRLDQYVSRVTDLSRSQARKAIRGGRVSVDGVQQLKPESSVDEERHVQLDDEELSPPGHRYLMMHKPLGVVCATKDRTHTTVLDLLDLPLVDRLHIAGRLDIDTTGLVLITDDGDWSHQITSPHKKCAKRYRVELAEPLKPRQLQQLQRGVLLRSEKAPTKPAEVVEHTANKIDLIITEGRYHQVKRMLAAVGNQVVRLHREVIGGLVLDENLAPGEYRPLDPHELSLVLGTDSNGHD